MRRSTGNDASGAELDISTPENSVVSERLNQPSSGPSGAGVMNVDHWRPQRAIFPTAFTITTVRRGAGTMSMSRPLFSRASPPYLLLAALLASVVALLAPATIVVSVTLLRAAALLGHLRGLALGHVAS